MFILSWSVRGCFKVSQFVGIHGCRILMVDSSSDRLHTVWPQSAHEDLLQTFVHASISWRFPTTRDCLWWTATRSSMGYVLPLAKQYDCLGCGGQIIENHCKSSFWIFWMLLHDFACADSCQTGSYCANKMQCGKHWGYGCHRNPAWDETLRLPRNPFPGSRAREMTYLRELAEIGVATCPSPSTPLGVGFVS